LGGRRLQQTTPANLLAGVPRSIDWKARGMDTSVKNQKRCNSCYAFSVNAALEILYKMKYGKSVDLSE